MLRTALATFALLGTLATSAVADVRVSLNGSPASMLRQHGVAEANDYTFLRTADQVERFVEKGYLVPVEGNADYELAKVSFPYARPELRTFLERLAAQHRAACGERLVVTSLTRPVSSQPRNSHPLSVHPAGMAVDLRVLDRVSCREWLEETLLALEDQGLLDVTREHYPPHYHVAVFPDAYMAHVERLVAADSARAEEEREAAARALARLASTAHPLVAVAERPAPERDPRAPAWWAWLVAAPLVAGGFALRLRRRKRQGAE